MIDEKETTIDYDAILGDFDGFLKERNWEGCNAIIDNLRDLKEYSKGIELAKRLCAAKLRVPADYGEEKSPMDTIATQFNTINKALYCVEPFKKEEEVIY